MHRRDRRHRVFVEVLGEERGSDEARTDRVHPDAFRSVLQCGVLGQAEDAVLGCDIGDRARESHGAEDRRHVDDRAAAVASHRGDLRASAEEDAVEVDRHHGSPSIQGILAGGRLRAPDPGVVHPDVETSELVDGRCDHRLDRLRIGDVGLVRRRATPRRFDRGRDPLGGVGIQIGDEHRGASFGHRLGASFTDARPTAGDDPNLPFERFSHVASVPGRRRRNLSACRTAILNSHPRLRTVARPPPASRATLPARSPIGTRSRRSSGRSAWGCRGPPATVASRASPD